MRRLTVYGFLSVALLFAQPGYNAISAWAILLGGAAGSLSLAVDCSSDFYSKMNGGGSCFNPEAAMVFSGAMVIWSIGGFFAFRCTSRERIVSFALLICIWIIGSMYNIWWFAIRGL